MQVTAPCKLQLGESLGTCWAKPAFRCARLYLCVKCGRRSDSTSFRALFDWFPSSSQVALRQDGDDHAVAMDLACKCCSGWPPLVGMETAQESHQKSAALWWHFIILAHEHFALWRWGESAQLHAAACKVSRADLPRKVRFLFDCFFCIDRSTFQKCRSAKMWLIYVSDDWKHHPPSYPGHVVLDGALVYAVYAVYALAGLFSFFVAATWKEGIDIMHNFPHVKLLKYVP